MPHEPSFGYMQNYYPMNESRPSVLYGCLAWERISTIEIDPLYMEDLNGKPNLQIGFETLRREYSVNIGPFEGPCSKTYN